jgi:hypothetical protein
MTSDPVQFRLKSTPRPGQTGQRVLSEDAIIRRGVMLHAAEVAAKKAGTPEENKYAEDTAKLALAAFERACREES